MSSHTLVTGADGFVGTALCAHLRDAGHLVRRATRKRTAEDTVAMGDISSDTDWRQLLQNCSIVVHLAARVHVMQDTSADPLSEFRKTNVAATLKLAQHAAAAGVSRFVYVSSIKVNGESTSAEHRFTEESSAAPEDAYSISKLEAEIGLWEIAQATGMEVVVLRPPLVYGPGVGANFLRLMRAIDKGWPLPLGCIRNQRSLVFLGNLVDAIQACTYNPAAAGRTFLVSDGTDLSTPALVHGLAKPLGRAPVLLPIPVALLKLAGKVLGKGDAISRLVDSLRVDNSLLCRTLNWAPPYTVTQGLEITGQWFRRNDNS